MKSLRKASFIVMVACLAFGCDDPPDGDDGGVVDAGTLDAAAPVDAAGDDAGPDATVPPDGGHEDGGAADGGTDAGPEPDAGPIDGGIDPATIPAPRPIEPASGAFTTSFQVRFRYELTAPATGARVEICRDLACADIRTTLDIDGDTGTVPVPPDPGATSRTFYFRLTGRADGVLGTRSSPVWSFSVHGRVGAAASATWGSTHDFNGDRLSDVLGGAPDSSTVRFYRGRTPIGTAPAPDTTISGTPALGIGTAIFSAGDVDGDGLLDLAIGTATDLLIYHGVAGGWPTSMSIEDADTTVAGVTPTASTAASAGDVDGDGYADVVVSDPSMTRITLYRGGPGGLETTGTPLDGTEAGFGISIAGGCDVNADGYADVIVGATDAALILLGSPTGLDVASAHPLTPGPSSAGFGASVACAGDVNGDGYPDIIIGAPGDNAAFIYHGNATATFTTPDGALRKPPGVPPGGGTLQGDAFGTTVAAAGDVNGDGFSDVVVTAPEVYPDNTSFFGSAFVFHGSASGLPATPTDASTTHQRALGATPPENRITATNHAGDVDGDGFDDVVTGTPLRDSGAGAILLNLGEDTTTAPSGVAAWLIGGGALSGFGTTLCR